MIGWAAAKGVAKRVPREVWLGLIVATVAALVVWRFYAWAYERGADSLRVELATAQSQLAVAQAANASNLETITKLVTENKAWADAAQAQEQKAAAAVAAVAQERDALARELVQRRKDRQVIYEQDQAARDWGRAPIPELVARQLRE